jgi:hypothetical protein
MDFETTQKLYVGFANTDLTEGRGYQEPIFWTLHEATAMRLAKGRDVQGSDASIREVDIITISGHTPLVPCNVLRLTRPTKEDVEAQKNIELQKQKQKQFEAILDKYPLTEEELALIREATKK